MVCPGRIDHLLPEAVPVRERDASRIFRLLHGAMREHAPTLLLCVRMQRFQIVFMSRLLT